MMITGIAGGAFRFGLDPDYRFSFADAYFFGGGGGRTIVSPCITGCGFSGDLEGGGGNCMKKTPSRF
jgi:hypothetical protein